MQKGFLPCFSKRSCSNNLSLNRSRGGSWSASWGGDWSGDWSGGWGGDWGGRFRGKRVRRGVKNERLLLRDGRDNGCGRASFGGGQLLHTFVELVLVALLLADEGLQLLLNVLQCAVDMLQVRAVASCVGCGNVVSCGRSLGVNSRSLLDLLNGCLGGVFNFLFGGQSSALVGLGSVFFRFNLLFLLLNLSFFSSSFRSHLGFGGGGLRFGVAGARLHHRGRSRCNNWCRCNYWRRLSSSCVSLRGCLLLRSNNLCILSLALGLLFGRYSG